MDSEDPLDAIDFDPIAYINSYFPTESSMKRLEPFVARVDSTIVQLDEDISQAVQAQSEAGERAAKDIAAAKGAIHELHTKVLRLEPPMSEFVDTATLSVYWAPLLSSVV